MAVPTQAARQNMTTPSPNRRILIVDDDPDIGWMLKRYLERNDMLVEQVLTGRNFRQKWQDATFDLVIIDLTLPDDDGFQIVQWLREQKYKGGIIVLTASTESSDTVTSLELGADDHVIKPFEPRVVLARIKSVLRSRDAVTSPSPA